MKTEDLTREELISNVKNLETELSASKENEAMWYGKFREANEKLARLCSTLKNIIELTNM